MATTAAKHLVINDNRLTDAILNKTIFDEVFESTIDDWSSEAKYPQFVKRWLIMCTSLKLLWNFVYLIGVMNTAQNLLLIKIFIDDHEDLDYKIHGF